MQQISPPIKYDVIKHILCKTIQCLILIISRSCLDISVHPLVWISFRFEIHWQLLSILTLPRNTKWGLLPFNENFQTGIILVIWKCFEFCKSLGYSSGIQHSDCDKKKRPIWSSHVILGDPMGVSPSKSPFCTYIFTCLQFLKNFSLNISPIFYILVIFERRITWGFQNWYYF